MIFELLDTDSEDLVGEYDRRDEALRAIAGRVRRDGPGAVDRLALAWLDPERGRSQEIACGPALATLALANAQDDG